MAREIANSHFGPLPRLVVSLLAAYLLHELKSACQLYVYVGGHLGRNATCCQYYTKVAESRSNLHGEEHEERLELEHLRDLEV